MMQQNIHFQSSSHTRSRLDFRSLWLDSINTYFLVRLTPQALLVGQQKVQQQYLMQVDIFKGYNGFTTGKGNIIWMGTMALAWKQFASLQGADKLEFAGTNPQSERTISALNNSKFSKDEISSASVYVKAGRGPQTQDTINEELFQKFPKCSFPPLNYNLKQESIISFAYLFKKLAFKETFERKKWTTFKFEGKQVESFFAEDDDQKQQIRSHIYKGENEFCISITDKENKDAIVFIKTERELTVQDAINQAMDVKLQEGEPLRTQDKFEMPIVEIDVTRSYEQMMGVTLTNGKANGPIDVMTEALKLKIDEEGATVQSNACMVMDECAIYYNDVRQYHLDRKFWIVMRETGKFPYLCIQIKEPIDA